VITDEEAKEGQKLLLRLRDNLNQVVFGQEALVSMVIVAVVARGHLLLEGLPGLGKTEIVKGLARSLELDAKRIQFTPDLLPADITGSAILTSSAARPTFTFQEGPLFANIVLADEINRASPKTQSALLEAMQERRVTILGESRPLPAPFFVLATQNPIELEGTYPLPEAQLDRFLFKLNVTGARPEILERIVKEREMGVEFVPEPVMSRSELERVIDLARHVFMPDVVANFIARLMDATHPERIAGVDDVRYGAGPRAALGLAAASKASALLHGRINASFEDVHDTAPAVLGHRIVLDYSARIKGTTTADIVRTLLDKVPRQSFETPSTVREARP
jgi:MoxR-like ATPase